jgi:hypothetical protein
MTLLVLTDRVISQDILLLVVATENINFFVLCIVLCLCLSQYSTPNTQALCPRLVLLDIGIGCWIRGGVGCWVLE